MKSAGFGKDNCMGFNGSGGLGSVDSWIVTDLWVGLIMYEENMIG
jgi:hypothetical protein